MEVPLDYRDPGGKKAQIGVMKLKAKGAPEEKLGTIVVNPGGPGGSGMMQAAQAAASLNGTDITWRFDIVGFDPAMGTAERRIELHAGFQRSFEKMAESCAKQADYPLGTDPERATEEFQKIMQPLARKPVPTEGGRLVGFHQGTGGVLGGLYYSQVWPGIVEGLRQVKDEGRGDKLLQINDAFGTRAPNGEWSNQTEANLVVNCNDEQRLSLEETDELRQEIARVNPILDPGTDLASGGRDACEHWPSEPSLGFPYAQDVTDMPEALIVSITGDPVTPYPAGQSIAEDIGGRVLTVDGETHTTAMSGASECVTDAVNAYFVSGELPPEGARCAL